MLLDTINVRTPYDDPLQYEPDWRYQIAKAWAANPYLLLPPELENDVYILNLKNYLIQSNLAENDFFVDPNLKSFRILLSWYSNTQDQSPKNYIEALLLTNADYKIISEDMSGGKIIPDVFKLYEKLFFNVRDDNGDLTRSCYLRSYMAMPNAAIVTQITPEPILWRVVATQFGYFGLVRLWRWRDFHGQIEDAGILIRDLFNMAQAIIMRRLLKNEINNFDLNTVFSNYINYETAKQQELLIKEKDASLETLLLQLLGQLKPKMLTAAKTADEIFLTNKALQSRIESQKMIQSQAINDRGTALSINKLNNIINQHLNNGNGE